MRFVLAAVLVAFVALPAAGIARSKAGSALTVGQLRWDGRDRPLGFLQFEPRLAWTVTSAVRAQKQTAYQVLVASSQTKLAPGKADLWDSGKVASEESINVRYAGPSPTARQRAFFTVRVWDRNDRPSAFAPASFWEMGLYDEEWEGQWIGRPRDSAERADAPDRSVTYLRKAFSLPKGIAKARLYASAFGVYRMSINGRAVSEDVLAPGFTDFHKRVLFQTYDVTGLLRKGDNVIAAVVAGGWCTAGAGGRAGACGLEPPRVMAQLEVTLADGRLQVVVSDETWRAHEGPTVTAHLYDGETYDARRAMPGWDTARFPGEGWVAARQYDKEIERDLVADPGPRTRVSENLRPIKVTRPRPGAYVFDLGQNVTGWARLAVNAPAGTTVTLRYAEALAPDGTLTVGALGGAKAMDRYITRGSGAETWEPGFSVRGFRYVEVTGLTSRPGRDAITGRVVHSVMPAAGRLITSNPHLNRLMANIDWSQRGSFLSVPTGGPATVERRGGMLDARAFALTGCLNRDVQSFYRKWIDDIRDAQHPTAAYGDESPRASEREGGPAGSAGVLVPFALYRCYADRTALDAHMTSMGRWLDFVRAKNPDLVWTNALGAFAGDPFEASPATDKTLIATAELVAAADAVVRIARYGGADLMSYVRRYDELARAVRAAFARRFVAGDRRLTSDTQGAYAFAIALGVLSGDALAGAGRHLVAAVERHGHHPATGVLGSAHLLPALSKLGRDDLAYRLLLEETCPSWLCSVKRGATTLPERWDPAAAQGRPGGGSLNHYALGAVGEWMYDAIGGIALDPGAPAGKRVIVRPRPGGGLSFARASYASLYGPIRTEWRREAGAFRLKVDIPANASATVTLPFAGQATEGGRKLEAAPGVTAMNVDRAGTTLAVESGRYDFSVGIP